MIQEVEGGVKEDDHMQRGEILQRDETGKFSGASSQSGTQRVCSDNLVRVDQSQAF